MLNGGEFGEPGESGQWRGDWRLGLVDALFWSKDCSLDFLIRFRSGSHVLGTPPMSDNPLFTNPTDASVIGPIERRYSPYLFEDKSVSDQDLKQCLEAARWAASSFNDQPWSWIVARREDQRAFAAMLGILAEPNQAWAAKASVLIVSVIRTTFRRNGQANRVALHDLGAAAAMMSLQATALGLQIHQMAGIDVAAAAKIYQVPDDHQVQTAIAIGYPMTGQVDPDDESMRQRERDARQRLTLGEQVFSETWGRSAAWLT